MPNTASIAFSSALIDETGAEIDGAGTEIDGAGTETDETGTDTDETGTEIDGAGTETDVTGTESIEISVISNIFILLIFEWFYFVCPMNKNSHFLHEPLLVVRINHHQHYL